MTVFICNPSSEKKRVDGIVAESEKGFTLQMKHPLSQPPTDFQDSAGAGGLKPKQTAALFSARACFAK
jgi:hypothetical protein